MTTKTKKSKSAFDEELLDGLLENRRTREDILGKDGLFAEIKEALIDRILSGEIQHHLGYRKHDKTRKEHSNRRNGNYSKTIMDGSGDQLAINVPRDRESSFEPEFVPKGLRRLERFDDQVISMYARGMSVREIQGYIKELYDKEVSADLISEITDEVIKEVEAWQHRPLDEIYPIVYLDCLNVKGRDNHMIINKAVYLAVGVSMEGHKEVLGIWIGKNEGAKFWMQVITELKNRGVQDILIACVDGLKGFEEAIQAVFPKTKVQLCIVHMIRNSTKYVSWKDRKEVCKDLKEIYSAVNEEEGLKSLKGFEEKWAGKYPAIAEMWERHWSGLAHLFEFPKSIRKAIYTTNIIEAINRQIRKIIKNKGVFPDDKSIKKILYLALKNAQKKWTMPIRNWSEALNQFSILFEDRIKL